MRRCGNPARPMPAPVRWKSDRAPPSWIGWTRNCASCSPPPQPLRSEEHTSELQSLMRISYAVFCLKKKKVQNVNSNYRDPVHLTEYMNTTQASTQLQHKKQIAQYLEN